MPHTTKIAGKMMHELAVSLTCRGNEVSVCTPVPEKGLAGESHLDDVNVYRFYSGRIKNQPKAVRFVNEFLLSGRAWSQLRRSAFLSPYDGIIFYSPSIFWGPLVSRLKRLWNCGTYLILRDIFPQWAVDAGVIKQGSLPHKIFEYYESKNYAAADCIAVQSPSNREFAEGKAEKVEVLYNWTLPKPRRRDPWLREKYNLQEKIVFFYGGNIGVAQDMENLVRLARGLKNAPAAQFVFLGQGDEVDLVRRLVLENSVENLIVDKPVSQELYHAALAEIDIGLLSLHAMHKSHNYPGKLLGYLESGVPVLASLNSGNDLIDLINQNDAGFAHVNGEDEKLAHSAIHLATSPRLRSEKGANSRRLLDSHFHVSKAADSILDFFQSFQVND
jgi:glycosyltransferase involved in cell wall biosynthesis